MKPYQLNYKNDFRNISKVLETISEGISDIKKMLNINDMKRCQMTSITHTAISFITHFEMALKMYCIISPSILQ